MAITYNAGTNIITVVGYTEATPCNFTDIYNADVAGGWGVVTRQCTNQFCFDCGLTIGDGSTTTWFGDLGKIVTFRTYNILIDGTYSGAVLIKPNSTFRVGEIYNASDKIGKNGCILFFYVPTYTGCYSLILDGNSNGEFYDASIYAPNIKYHFGNHALNGHTGDLIIWNSKMNTKISTTTTNDDISKIEILVHTTQNSYGLSSKAVTISLMDIKIFGARVVGAIYSTGGADITVRNLYARDNDYLVRFSGGSQVHLIDADTDTWDVAYSSSHVTNKLYRENSFNLNVIDKDENNIVGAAVKVWDKNNVLVINKTTDANGTITESILIHGTKTYPINTFVLETPHLIKIEKAGYTTYEADFTLDDKTDWLIALQAAGGGLMRNPPMTGGMV